MTAPFPFHPAVAPQAPMLRPDPLHEEPGALGSLTPILLKVAQQVQEQQQHQQEMLIQRGKLANEQELADLQKKKFNEENKRRQLAAQALDHHLSGGQIPHPAAEAAAAAMGVDSSASPGGAGGQPPQGGGQPDIGAIASSPDAGMQQIAGHMLEAHRQQQIGQQAQGVLGDYSGEQLRTDPNARMEALGKLYGIDPIFANNWDKANPPRKLTITAHNDIIMAIDAETGEVVKVINSPGKLNALQNRMNQYAPQYQFGIAGMQKIEQIDAASAALVASTVIGSGSIKLLGTKPQDFVDALAKQTFTGNAAKYHTYLLQAVEASLGLQMGGRGGQPLIDLVQNVLLPKPQTIGDPNVMQALWEGRKSRIATWKDTAIHGMIGDSDTSKTGDGAADNNDIAQLTKLLDKVLAGGK